MSGEMLQAALDLRRRGMCVLDAPYGKKEQDQDGWNTCGCRRKIFTKDLRVVVET
jgi:hypothetical protein